MQRRADRGRAVEFRSRIIATHEYCVCSGHLRRVDHDFTIYCIECLDDLGLWEGLLKLFTEGFRSSDAWRKYVCNVDVDLASKIFLSRRA